MRQFMSIKITTAFILGFVGLSQAQEREGDTIKTDVINVVKPYSPSVNDAFKVKETPSIQDDQTATKKDVQYNIFSFPVASTFTPAKGKAATLDRQKQEKLHDNYATFGIGNYTNILGELYLNHTLSRSASIGGHLTHHSSFGGINDLLVDDSFSNTNLNVNYSEKQRDMSWMVQGGGLYQFYNWYGIPQPEFTGSDVVGIDVGHNYYGVHLGGELQFYDTYIKSLDVLYRHFGDNFSSGENRFTLNSTVDVPIGDQEISTDVVLDYLGGSFERNYMTIDGISYGNFQIGLASSYQLRQDDLTVDIGAAFYYMNDTEASDSKFYIYPKIAASYRLVDEVLIAYGSILGGLNQNSYYDFVQENPFVSPTLYITPTDTKYDVSVGLKGKLSNAMSYDVSGHFKNENNKALFRSNLIPYGYDIDEDYQYGNSFGVVYDDVKTFSMGGALSADVNRNFTLGLKGEFFAYNTDNQDEAWNLPSFTASLFSDYQINKKWFAGAELYYVGQRKALLGYDDNGNPSLPILDSPTQTVDLDSYFDANIHAGYHINDKFSAYLKGSNLFNNSYDRWVNYPVQGLQILAGATYKFDF